MKIPFLIGRIVFGGYFIYSGIHHFTERKSMAQYAGAKRVPAPEAGVALTGAMLLLGGTSVLLGLKPKMGTAVLVAFLASVSPWIHDFWRTEDPNQRRNDMIHFAKNMALLGATLSLMGVDEPWPASVPVAKPAPHQRVLQFARKLAA
jgi:putative oxidoreductase